MNEQQLRDLVREAVARHLGARRDPPSAIAHHPAAIPHFPLPIQTHPSHAMYLTIVNAGDGCQIEPAVGCNHCGYCKSHGY